MPYVPKISHEDRAKKRIEIALACYDGMSIREACKHFDCSYSYVQKACYEFGKKLRYNAPLPSPNSFAILRELLTGRKESDIARKFNVSDVRVYKIRDDAIEGGFYELAKE